MISSWQMVAYYFVVAKFVWILSVVVYVFRVTNGMKTHYFEVFKLFHKVLKEETFSRFELHRRFLVNVSNGPALYTCGIGSHHINKHVSVFVFVYLYFDLMELFAAHFPTNTEATLTGRRVGRWSKKKKPFAMPVFECFCIDVCSALKMILMKLPRRSMCSSSFGRLLAVYTSIYHISLIYIFRQIFTVFHM